MPRAGRTERADVDGVRVLWRQQPGLVWMSKAIAQQPTLWRRRPKKQRAGGCRPVAHTVGALCARRGKGPPGSADVPGALVRVIF